MRRDLVAGALQHAADSRAAHGLLGVAAVWEQAGAIAAQLSQIPKEGDSLAGQRNEMRAALFHPLWRDAPQLGLPVDFRPPAGPKLERPCHGQQQEADGYLGYPVRLCLLDCPEEGSQLGKRERWVMFGSALG